MQLPIITEIFFSLLKNNVVSWVQEKAEEHKTLQSLISNVIRLYHTAGYFCGCKFCCFHLKIFWIFCSFNICGFKMPINSKIYKTIKWDKGMAQNMIRYCKLNNIITLSRGAKMEW